MDNIHGKQLIKQAAADGPEVPVCVSLLSVVCSDRLNDC